MPHHCVLIEDDGTEKPLELDGLNGDTEPPPVLRLPILMPGGFGNRIYFLTGEPHRFGRVVYRSRLQ